jgi:hypothetical protein
VPSTVPGYQQILNQRVSKWTMRGVDDQIFFDLILWNECYKWRIVQ